MLHGFDISGYNSSTAPTADFVFVKATEGSSYKSGSFAAQWRSAKSRAAVRGAYHFARPEQSSYKDQAKWFLDTVQPSPGEPLALDLEASNLSQLATNAWARNWGDYIANELGEQQDVYLGSGYASNGTGRDLAKHFRHWWYAQYPSAYQIAQGVDLEGRRASNRSSLHPLRSAIAMATSKWPPAVTPWLPSGITTGWPRPDIWQFTDNWKGYDASVSALTLAQLAGGGRPTPQEDSMLSGSFTGGKGEKPPVATKGGNFTKIFVGFDNTRENPDLGIVRQGPATFRFAPHVGGRKGETFTVTVGAALDDTKGRPDAVETALPAGCDYIAVERTDDGGRPVAFSVY